eukprot:CAMPEP_0172527882 /NCGR_PEP_ID=MMETSP1067-20121228/2434_1 /TAXON_ID=265564 ORGANISM="Thalassiosira punctigera, Strain Tpunct2005C2" /NCGR_SAMPLE_ID=MMETSP1067 /ASSEMBLY_ACC=CAM_ASM_000444 /LENGTH=378 /DNA_ID=CAMNT_0013311703 /DNA_START=1 /DNA_END=1138 /DNA_ORIENTATION=+
MELIISSATTILNTIQRDGAADNRPLITGVGADIAPPRPLRRRGRRPEGVGTGDDLLEREREAAAVQLAPPELHDIRQIRALLFGLCQSSREVFAAIANGDDSREAGEGGAAGGAAEGIFEDEDEDDGSSVGSWAEASAAADERKKKAAERRVEAAYDAAVKGYDARVASRTTRPSPAGASDGKYQFVGVVHDGKAAKKSDGVTWYARKKPRGSKWNVRLVHVNRDAVLRDLFLKGKVDVYGKYVNEGLDAAAFAAAETSGEDADGGEKEAPGLKPLIKAHYEVKERSWKTLWNFSPMRFFATPSGSFWRERRIDPGLYTDGTTVYESVYRYRDGKNGMKPVAKLSNFLASPGLGYEEKMRAVERLKGGDEPDVVVEK